MASELAVTERGNRLEAYSEDDVNLGLRLLVLNGGDIAKTVSVLAEEGIVIKPAALRYWRDSAFPRRYAEIRNELVSDVGDELAARAMNRAMQADEAGALYIQAAVDKLDEVPAGRLAAAARDLTKAAADNINSSQLLRNRPTEIRETRDIGEILDLLRREGVLAADPRAGAIEGTATKT